MTKGVEKKYGKEKNKGTFLVDSLLNIFCILETWNVLEEEKAHGYGKKTRETKGKTETSEHTMKKTWHL